MIHQKKRKREYHLLLSDSHNSEHGYLLTMCGVSGVELQQSLTDGKTGTEIVGGNVESVSVLANRCVG